MQNHEIGLPSGYFLQGYTGTHLNKGGIEMKEIMEGITRFILDVEFESLPSDVVHSTKRMLLDSIGCAIAGTLVDKGKYAINVSKAIGGSPESTILGSNQRVSSLSASFANGELMNALDMDGLMFPAGHAPPMVTPAPLAMAEALSLSGKDLIVALSIAYELSIRLGGALSEWRWFVADDPDFVRMEMPAVSGMGFCIFAGVAGLAKVLGLDGESLGNAMGIAGHISPVPTMGKWSHTTPNAMTKYGSAGFISQAEILAVLLAKEGYTGDKTVLDGEHGFFEFCGSQRWRPELILKKIGEKWRFPTRIIYKPYPCCRAMHGGLDCFIDIIEKNSLNPEEIEEVKVFIDPLVTLPAWNVSEIHSHVDAQFLASYPFAAAAFRIKSGADWQKDENINNPDIQGFLKKIEVYAHPDYGKTILDDPRVPLSKVQVTARGKTFEEERDWKKGNPWPDKARMTDQELADKFKSNAISVLGQESTDNAIELLMNLEGVRDISILMEHLSGS
jgi:2-methylcitrate dehydratase PrpD